MTSEILMRGLTVVQIVCRACVLVQPIGFRVLYFLLARIVFAAIKLESAEIRQASEHSA